MRLAEALEHPKIIEKIIEDCNEGQRQINRARYLNVRKELLEGANPEINTDKEALMSRMEAFGFRHQIADSIEEIDKKLATAATDLDFKGIMDLVRTVYEETFEDVTKVIGNLNNKSISTGSDFKPFRVPRESRYSDSR